MKVTTIFKSVDECISFAKHAQTSLPNINTMLDGTDFQAWTDKLNISSDFEKFLLDSPFNLLNTLVIKGFADKKQLSNPIIMHVNILLAKVDLFLNSFSELKTDKSFTDKLKNLGGLNFLSTLSELSLAYYFKKLGFTITFEKAFSHNLSGKTKDIDLTIKKNGEEFNIEVYMPNKQTDVKGFFDPLQDDNHFRAKVKNKLITKFGVEGISGLKGQTLLGVNKIFFDMMHIKTILPILNNSKTYDNLINSLPKNIDGLIIFEDEFGHENSFHLEKIIQKVK